MGCASSIVVPTDDFEQLIEHYNSQSVDSFGKEVILCSGCNKCFKLSEDKIKINCALCNKFYHCNIAGKCSGHACRIVLDDEINGISYCNNCAQIVDGRCFCKRCLT